MPLCAHRCIFDDFIPDMNSQEIWIYFWKLYIFLRSIFSFDFQEKLGETFKIWIYFLNFRPYFMKIKFFVLFKFFFAKQYSNLDNFSYGFQQLILR